MKAMCALAWPVFVSVSVFAMMPVGAEDQGYRGVLKLDDPESVVDAKGWSSSSAVAVGDFYSVVFQTKSAGGVLAEYYQRVFVFGGTARDGELLGAFRLQMNVGGRTHVLLYRHVDEKGKVRFVTFQDRHGEQTIDLGKRDFFPERDALPSGLKKEFIGTYSGEAYPEKFVTPLVLAEEESVKRVR